MRLVTYSAHGRARVGAWIDDDRMIVDLAASAEPRAGAEDLRFASMQALIEAGPEALDVARAIVEAPGEFVVETQTVQLLAPLPRPVQFRDFLAFPDHLAGCNATLVELAALAAPDPDGVRAGAAAAGKLDTPKEFFLAPFYYNCNALTVVGPDAPIHWPAYSHFIDYELEMAAVIGTAGAQIKAADARSHIFGYTIFNDWSARDEQVRAMEAGPLGGPLPAKDFASTLGPCIVTADEFDDPYALEMTAYLNGERVGGGRSGSMHYRFETLIEYLTRGHAVCPGEVLGSGTVGTGCSLENRRLVRPGDTVELRIEGIGALRNQVLAPHLEDTLPDAFFPALGAAIARARQGAGAA